ncbi:hypothetical protein ABZ802_35755 [Streptomyces sp. NPDC047737]|uniref:hypothetical protein n=1 Tax=Streptomyces sp. NPDC047737 TaxID=3155740 RepID=UPI0033D32426
MTTPQNSHDDRDALADVLRDALDAYFTEVDPEDADTDDMAWTLVRAIERAGK